jgi:hypothetical protein
MGWGSGVRIAAELLEELQPLFDDELGGAGEAKLEVCRAIIRVFEAADCDNLYEIDDPTFLLAMELEHPDRECRYCDAPTGEEHYEGCHRPR